MSFERFKQCTLCGRWFSLWDLAHHPDITPLGMALDPELEWNLFHFTHDVPGCGTTFVIPVTALAPLLPERPPPHRLTGTACCERHCLNISDVATCGQVCAYAPYRRLFLTLMRKRQAREERTGGRAAPSVCAQRVDPPPTTS